MGDFAASDLWAASYLTVHPGTPCTGCAGRIDQDDRCYAASDQIWHSHCWPSTHGERQKLEMQRGRWKAPEFTPRDTNMPWWTGPGFEYVDRLCRAGVRIKALKLTDEQYEQAASYMRSSGLKLTHLFGYPIKRGA